MRVWNDNDMNSEQGSRYDTMIGIDVGFIVHKVYTARAGPFIHLKCANLCTNSAHKMIGSTMIHVFVLILGWGVYCLGEYALMFRFGITYLYIIRATP